MTNEVEAGPQSARCCPRIDESIPEGVTALPGQWRCRRSVQGLVECEVSGRADCRIDTLHGREVRMGCARIGTEPVEGALERVCLVQAEGGAAGKGGRPHTPEMAISFERIGEVDRASPSSGDACDGWTPVEHVPLIPAVNAFPHCMSRRPGIRLPSPSGEKNQRGHGQRTHATSI